MIDLPDLVLTAVLLLAAPLAGAVVFLMPGRD